MNIDNPYTKMQQGFYDKQADKWSLENRDPVVGSFNKHNMWKDYEYLFQGLKTRNMVALDFGCGPGRAMALYWNRFERIDGADISQTNLNKVLEWFAHNEIEGIPVLYKTNGISLDTVPSGIYDLVFSTITLQHICVYEIRKQIITDIFRVLKNGGVFTAQMGYGTHVNSVGYFDNNYEALVTNGRMDTRIENTDDLKNDLEQIGFVDFEYVLGETGPGDVHEKWIYFRCKKL